MRQGEKNNRKFDMRLMAIATLAMLATDALAATAAGRDTMQVNLDEVLVQVPYGTVSKEALTGAASAITEKDIAERPLTSVTAALEGMTTGVYANSSAGQPGNEASIIIRGIGTVNGTVAPLYILNGVPYDGSLSDINPSDVKSITVLKDAAACALYGNRAANGVILIETKRGRSERINVNFNMRLGSYSRGMSDYDRVNAKEFMEVSWTELRNYRQYKFNEDAATAGQYASGNLMETLGVNIFNKDADKLFDSNGKLTEGTEILPQYAEDLDWWDQATRAGFRQEYNVNVGQSRNKYDYYASVGYLSENGYLKNNGFDRISGNVRANFRPLKWLEAGLTFNAVITKQTNSYDTTSDGNYNAQNAFYFCRNIAPIYPVHQHDKNGSYMYAADGSMLYDKGSYTDSEGNAVTTRRVLTNENIIEESEKNSFTNKRKKLNGSAYVKFKFLRDFSFTASGNINHYKLHNVSYLDPTIGSGTAYEGLLRYRDYTYNIYDFQQQLDWKHNFGLHGVEAMAGHESYEKKYNYEILSKTHMTETGVREMYNYTTTMERRTYDVKYRTESYFARARYNYDNRYHFMASIRYDGSSRFSSDNRWGTFGSIGAGWVISNEKFMKKAKWVNFLKLRTDYGTTGNDAAVGYYGSYTLYSAAFKVNGQQSAMLSQWSDVDLHWEKGKSFGVALESRLFNRWNFNIEYFYRRNQDLLFDITMASSVGAAQASGTATTVTRNVGSIGNKGLELSTDVDIVRTRNWTVNFGVNFTHIRNRVESLPEENKDGITSGLYRVEVGKPMNSFYLYSFAGVDQLTGNSMYKANLDDYCVLTDEGEYIAGNAEGANIQKYVTKIGDSYYVNNATYAKKEFYGTSVPTVYGSFKPSVRWKDLTVSALFTFALGGKVFDESYRQLMCTATEKPHSYHKDILDSWTEAPEGMTEDASDRLLATGIPQINSTLSDNNNAQSSRFLVSGDYLIFKNLCIGYSMPRKIMDKWHLQALQFQFTCENLFVASARKGLNPQQTISGFHTNSLSTPRIFTIGVDVKF